jgi:hypothetical protein
MTQTFLTWAVLQFLFYLMMLNMFNLDWICLLKVWNEVIANQKPKELNIGMGDPILAQVCQQGRLSHGATSKLF